jgi:SRSO17 transposase
VQRADERLTAADAKAGRRHRLAHRTVRDSVWRASVATVWVAGRQHTLVVAINEATAEVKYFLSNATAEPLARVLAVAFRRWTVEHAFRLGKQEAGLMHYEGRDYTGLLRHLLPALVVLGFVATHTERLRGEKSAGHRRAGVSGAQPAVRCRVSPSPGHSGDAAHQRGHPLLPATERAGDKVAQKEAA